MVTVAAWLFVALVGVVIFMALIGNPFIDWLDARTSRITYAEARARAQLAGRHRWPPKSKQLWTGATEWIALTVGLLVILGLTVLYRYSSR